MGVVGQNACCSNTESTDRVIWREPEVSDLRQVSTYEEFAWLSFAPADPGW
jgi:hypothetical protein